MESRSRHVSQTVDPERRRPPRAVHRNIFNPYIHWTALRRLPSSCSEATARMAALPRPRAALAARTLLLASAVAFCAAVPVKTPTARPGECWNTMLGELKASDLPGKVRSAAFLPLNLQQPPPPPPLTRPLYFWPLPALELQGYGLIFYGDSIVESLRGTDKCRTGPCKSSKTRSLCATTPKVGLRCQLCVGGPMHWPAARVDSANQPKLETAGNSRSHRCCAGEVYACEAAAGASVSRSPPRTLWHLLIHTRSQPTRNRRCCKSISQTTAQE